MHQQSHIAVFAPAGAKVTNTRLNSGHYEDPNTLAEQMLGKTIGCYELKRVLGVGGMGAVYCAEHRMIRSRVALKLLHRRFCNDATIVRRFFNEARAVNMIGHDNIIKIYDFSTTADGQYYFVMEYLEGVTLSKFITGPTPLDRVSSIIFQVMDALAAAHRAGVIHRDLKPENVLIAKMGNHLIAKVLDFGIAKLYAPELDVVRTNAGAMLGTPHYMSPEQVFGEPTDARTDIYSLGVILFWIATGRLVFEEKILNKLLLSHAYQRPPRPSEVRPELGSAFDELIGKALSKEREERFQTIDQMRGAFERVLEKVAAAADALRAIMNEAENENAPNQNPANENRGNENRGNENRGNENRGNENRGNENRANENRANENRGNENRGNENRGNENRAKENRANENRAKENRAPEDRANENRESGASPSASLVNGTAQTIARAPDVFQEVELRTLPVASRKDKRVRTELEVFVRIGSIDGFRRMYSMDISRHGMFIATDQKPPPLHSEVDVVISSPDGASAVSLAARIVRLVSAVEAGAFGGKPGMGVQLLNLDAEKRTYIERLIDGLPTIDVPRPATRIANPRAQAIIARFEASTALTPYQILQIAPSSDASKVREAVRKMRRELSPELIGPVTLQQSEALARINDRVDGAASMLLHPATRAAYDATCGNFFGVAAALAAGLSLGELAKLRAQFLASRHEAAATARIHVRAALLAEYAGSFTEARNELEHALAADPLDAELHNRYWALRHRTLDDAAKTLP